MGRVIRLRHPRRQAFSARLRRRHGSMLQRLWPIALALLAVGILASVLLDLTPTARAYTEAHFAVCLQGRPANCVVDGDTLRVEGVKIRVADIDTPEIFSPQCAREKTLGLQATQRLLELVNAAPFEMRAWASRDEDQYGRKLRVLVRDGQSLGAILVAEGLARQWDGARRSWCV